MGSIEVSNGRALGIKGAQKRSINSSREQVVTYIYSQNRDVQKQLFLWAKLLAEIRNLFTRPQHVLP